MNNNDSKKFFTLFLLLGIVDLVFSFIIKFSIIKFSKNNSFFSSLPFFSLFILIYSLEILIVFLIRINSKKRYTRDNFAPLWDKNSNGTYSIYIFNWKTNKINVARQIFKQGKYFEDDYNNNYIITEYKEEKNHFITRCFFKVISAVEHNMNRNSIHINGNNNNVQQNTCNSNQSQNHTTNTTINYQEINEIVASIRYNSFNSKLDKNSKLEIVNWN